MNQPSNFPKGLLQDTLAVVDSPRLDTPPPPPPPPAPRIVNDTLPVFLVWGPVLIIAIGVMFWAISVLTAKI